MSRNFHPGMGQAVAERTILRKKANGSWESWDDVAYRVAKGNSMLCKTKEEQEEEFKILYKYLANASILMSGRHLQHGDETQPERPYEVFTNCSTSCTSFTLFYLLMSGSGVGRSYDDDIMLVNWDNAPTLRCVLDESHSDFDFSAHESVRDAKHKYGNGTDTLWHTVEDTREGWAKALEIWENSAFEKIHKDKLLILDFSKVRAKGTPIKGMQNRPASGPVPLMNAFYKALTLKGAGLPKFVQSMYIDHYFAECVLVGGARRAARMSTKYWKDSTIFDFITIKRPIEYYNKNVEEIVELRSSFKSTKPQGFLWSSNNSVMVDQEFWKLVNLKRNDPHYHDDISKHARKVFKLVTSASYGDGTGEPGLINVDKLNVNERGVDKLTKGEIIGSKKYQLEEDTNLYINRLVRKALKKPYYMIVNPCVTKDTWIQTNYGPRQVNDLIGVEFNAIVNGKPYKSSGFWKTGYKPVYLVKTNRGYNLKATDNHRLMLNDHTWVAIKDLKTGDSLVLANKDDMCAEIVAIEYVGEEDVYDCSVDDVHEFDANGIRAHNCSEISIALWGAYCCIGDLVPFHANSLDEAEEAFRAVTRALIRVNTMDALYNAELKRTNRIGVGMTGVHEFAWKFFKLGFKDLIDEEKSKDFWMVLSRFKRAVQDEAEKYSKKYGLEPPHTDTTLKPAGTNSKLFGLTEGWHLPSMLWYLRWVQFSANDPLVEVYHKAGYPTKALKKYQNTVIVGFPTIPVICELGMGDKLVTAGNASPEDQYKWIMLGEKYWIRGVNPDGSLLEKDTGNSISYTLKYKPDNVMYKDFVTTLKEYQPQIKCCSIMPQEEGSSYEYLPEQPVTKVEYEGILRNIKCVIQEDVDFAHVDCKSGACPIDFKKAV